jgi:pimeloyl-ACP methyl ester carboxylesterase
MKVYFISGLGADARAFRSLTLPGIEPVHLSWISPLPGESIEGYAKRMAERIEEPNPIIVGLSFGGMVSVEIAKQIPVKKLILISSAKGENELPPLFRMGRFLPVHKLVPARISKTAAALFFKLVGHRSKEQQETLVNMFNSSPEGFVRWAMNAVVHWKNKQHPENLVHIHGNTDWLLPYRYVKADHTINKGGHIMIVNQAKQIDALLQNLLFE